MRKRGRPAKQDPNRKLVTVDQAVKMSGEFWSQFNKKGVSKGHVYNLLWLGKLRGEHKGRYVLLDEKEVREKLCG